MNPAYLRSYDSTMMATQADSSAALGVLGAISGTYMVVMLIIAVAQIVAMWKVFEKAGEKGWKSIIPIYNVVTLYKIVGLSPWLLLLFLVPVVNGFAALVLTIIQDIKLAKAFGQGGGFAAGLIFLAPIFYLILGFGKSEYVGVQE